MSAISGKYINIAFDEHDAFESSFKIELEKDRFCVFDMDDNTDDAPFVFNLINTDRSVEHKEGSEAFNGFHHRLTMPLESTNEQATKVKFAMFLYKDPDTGKVGTAATPSYWSPILTEALTNNEAILEIRKRKDFNSSVCVGVTFNMRWRKKEFPGNTEDKSPYILYNEHQASVLLEWSEN